MEMGLEMGMEITARRVANWSQSHSHTLAKSLR